MRLPPRAKAAKTPPRPAHNSQAILLRCTRAGNTGHALWINTLHAIRASHGTRCRYAGLTSRPRDLSSTSPACRLGLFAHPECIHDRGVALCDGLPERWSRWNYSLLDSSISLHIIES